jgi:hypothetical protein
MALLFRPRDHLPGSCLPLHSGRCRAVRSAVRISDAPTHEYQGSSHPGQGAGLPSIEPLVCDSFHAYVGGRGGGVLGVGDSRWSVSWRPMPTTPELPDFLTVEEAARVLRIGRTAAYALARTWRDTNGREGLPAVPFGRLLRVPRVALEEMAGGSITATPACRQGAAAGVGGTDCEAIEAPTSPRVYTPAPPPAHRLRRPADPPPHLTPDARPPSHRLPQPR